MTKAKAKGQAYTVLPHGSSPGGAVGDDVSGVRLSSSTVGACGPSPAGPKRDSITTKTIVATDPAARVPMTSGSVAPRRQREAVVRNARPTAPLVAAATSLMSHGVRLGAGRMATSPGACGMVSVCVPWSPELR